MMRSEFKGEENTVQDAWTKNTQTRFDGFGTEKIIERWCMRNGRRIGSISWTKSALTLKEVNPPADNARPATW